MELLTWQLRSRRPRSARRRAPRGMGTRAPVDEEDAGKLLLGPGASERVRTCAAAAPLTRPGRLQDVPGAAQVGKGHDAGGGEAADGGQNLGRPREGGGNADDQDEVRAVARQLPGCKAARAARRRVGRAACCGVALSGAAVCAAPLSRVGRPCFCGSVFQKTYGYVTRFSYPNATVETAQSIRECATLMPHARAL